MNKNWEIEFENIFDKELRDEGGLFPNEEEGRTGIEIMEIFKSFISQILKKKDEEYLQWFRDFSTAMALENIKMPKDLKDVNAVCEGIREALKERDEEWRKKIKQAQKMWTKCLEKDCKNKVECKRANHYIETIWNPTFGKLLSNYD